MTKRLKGIYLNCDPQDTPEGYYVDGENIILDQEIGAVLNEQGTTRKTTLPSGSKVIGSYLLTDDTRIVFLDSNEIALFTGTSYQVIFKDDLLNFDSDYPIQADLYTDKQGDRILTWIDGNNPARFLNIDKVENPTETSLNLFPSISGVPQLEVTNVNNTGGSLKTGTYYIAIAYKHSDETITNFYDVVGPIPIISGNINSEELFRGSNHGIETSKSISMSFGNVDTEYESIQLAVIPVYNGVIDAVQLLPEIPITTTNYTYTGGESFSAGSLEEIQIDQAFYSKPKTIHINDDTIYLGNLEQQQDIGYQKYAKDITVIATNKVLENSLGPTGELENSFRDPVNSLYNKSFKRGEVYALYISWILKEGGESKAYHIPGRPPQTDGSQAQGSITVLSDAPQPDPEASATATTVITKSPDDSGTINVTYDGDPVNVSINAADTIDQVGDKIANDINADSTIGITAFYNSSEDRLTFTAKQAGEGENGKSVLIGTGSTGVTFSNHAPTMSGGESSQVGQTETLNVRFGGVNSPDGIIIEVEYGDTKDTIANDLANTLNEDNDANYTASVDSSGANPVITITAKEEGTFWNRSISIFSDMDDLNFSISSISGGTSAEQNSPEVFRFRSEPTTTVPNATGMGYWENENETYPDDPDIWDDLAGENVRHHHFPEVQQFPLTEPPDGQVGQLNVLGFKLTNIALPEEIKEKVLGYKIYYAKRTPENKRIIDQGVNIETRVEGNLYRPSYLNDGGAKHNGSPDSTAFHYHPFHSLRIRSPIGQVTHVKAVGKLVDSIFQELDGFNGFHTLRFTDLRNSVNVATSDRFRTVEAGSYIDSQSDPSNINLTSLGFDRNMDNNRGESKIIFKISSAYNETNFMFAGQDPPGSPYYLTDLFALKTSMYNSFDNQILESTNYVHTDLDNLNSEDIFGGDTFVNFYTYRVQKRYDSQNRVHVISIVCESPDNISYRRVGNHAWEGFYPHFSKLTLAALIWKDGNPQFSPEHNSDTRDVTTYDNYFFYNEDYSKTNDIRFPPLKEKEDKEPEKYPTRVIRSREGTSGLTRMFLPDDFIDLTTKRGELVKLSTYNNILIPHMERSLIRTRGREELQVGDIRAFLGSGDIFSVKPQELIYSDDGFGGIEAKEHSINTPYGYVFYDKDAHKMFLINNEGLQDIGEPIKPVLDNLDPSYIRLGYDPKYERLFVTFDDETWSYSFKIGGWISKHSFVPDWYIHTKGRMYTAKDNEVHEHNNGLRGKYYDVVHDSKYSYIDNRDPNISKVVMSLMINSIVRGPTGTVLDARTFDQFRIRNSFQDTGTVDIEYFANEPLNPYIGNARKTLNKWFINQFRDQQSIPMGVPESLKWQYQKKLEDHYHRVDLIKDNSLNRKITLTDTDLIYKNSIR